MIYIIVIKSGNVNSLNCNALPWMILCVWGRGRRILIVVCLVCFGCFDLGLCVRSIDLLVE